MTDWTRMARPQADGYDTEIMRQLAKERYDWTKTFPQGGTDTWLDGAVMLRRAEHAQGPNLIQAPLNHPHLAITEQWLGDYWPEFYAQASDLLQTVYPFVDNDAEQAPLRTGCSCGPMGNRVGFEISVSVNGAVGMLEGIAHEFGHSKLKVLGVSMVHWERLVANPEPTEEAIESGVGDYLYASMVRKDKLRPLGACIHGYYAYLYVTEMLRRLTGPVFTFESNAGWLQLMATRIDSGARQIREVVTPTEEGAAFFRGCDDWAQELIGWVAAQS